MGGFDDAANRISAEILGGAMNNGGMQQYVILCMDWIVLYVLQLYVCMDGEHIWTRFYELLADNGNDNSAIFAAARVLQQFKTGFR